MNDSEPRRLSELARRVLNAAQAYADQFEQPIVGVEHLLMALAGEHRSLSSSLMREYGFDALRLYCDPVRGGSCEALLESAALHAQRLGNHYTGTEHLLLALSTDEIGTALLAHYGADPYAIRLRLEQVLVS